jgi:hypothetical protein
MTRQISEKMTEVLVKPTVRKKVSVQACCGYLVRIFWPHKDSQAKSSQPVGEMTSADDASWSSTASSQAEYHQFNRRFMLF